ncbi:conserved hypothetical protein [Leptothrix cholodnii SP-6]|uniref:Transmembrane protein n=1 Tax=Leptothrix cholodnii (strain ATCC 51168 / LMG 8142 / SP-6) TaxID=395495 RepID=B1Y3J9_LEPCP|nr:hypothetical protein [Leptothrix cholodnii]ACB34527.1 conserved hypothetical protein [Leptothrix cholodnii SP-6]
MCQEVSPTRKQYKGVFTIFKRYWGAYGGLQALLRSPYLHFSIVLLVATSNTWINAGWWEQSIGVLPNLLGFTLGGFAIFIGFGDERFRQLLAEPDESEETHTVYVGLCSTFVHFIIVQVLALFCAILAEAWWFEFAWPPAVKAVLPALNVLGGAIGYGLFLYALTSVLAATMHIFRIATMYEEYQRSLSESAEQVE